jgi:hypothetical protein
MAASRPVVIASDQSAVPVSGTITANAGSGTFAISAAALPLPTGAATAANQATMNTGLGAPADTSATTDTGTFSLIALFKRALGYLSTIATAASDTTTASPVQVRSPSDLIPIAPTIDTAIYAAGDVLFATTAVANITRANDERAVLLSLTGIDKSKQKPAFTLFFYQTNVTSAAANAANNISDADAANLLGFVRVASTDWIDLANNSMFSLKGINLLLEAAGGTTTVYIVGVLDAGTPTFAAASDLVLKLGVVQS